MYCNKCGKPLTEGDQFCSGCGSRVDVDMPAPRVSRNTGAMDKDRSNFRMNEMRWDLDGYPGAKKSRKREESINWSSVQDNRDRKQVDALVNRRTSSLDDKGFEEGSVFSRREQNTRPPVQDPTVFTEEDLINDIEEPVKVSKEPGATTFRMEKEKRAERKNFTASDEGFSYGQSIFSSGRGADNQPATDYAGSNTFVVEKVDIQDAIRIMDSPSDKDVFEPDFRRNTSSDLRYSQDFSRDFSRDYSQEFGRDFSRDYSQEFGKDFSRDYSDDFSKEFSKDYSDYFNQKDDFDDYSDYEAKKGSFGRKFVAGVAGVFGKLEKFARFDRDDDDFDDRRSFRDQDDDRYRDRGRDSQRRAPKDDYREEYRDSYGRDYEDDYRNSYGRDYGDELGDDYRDSYGGDYGDNYREDSFNGFRNDFSYDDYQGEESVRVTSKPVDHNPAPSKKPAVNFSVPGRKTSTKTTALDDFEKDIQEASMARSKASSNNAPQTAKGRDKFYTFNQKSAEFQALLDEEYERLRKRIQDENGGPTYSRPMPESGSEREARVQEAFNSVVQRREEAKAENEPKNIIAKIFSENNVAEETAEVEPAEEPVVEEVESAEVVEIAEVESAVEETESAEVVETVEDEAVEESAVEAVEPAEAVKAVEAASEDTVESTSEVAEETAGEVFNEFEAVKESAPEAVELAESVEATSEDTIESTIEVAEETAGEVANEVEAVEEPKVEETESAEAVEVVEAVEVAAVEPVKEPEVKEFERAIVEPVHIDTEIDSQESETISPSRFEVKQAETRTDNKRNEKPYAGAIRFENNPDPEDPELYEFERRISELENQVGGISDSDDEDIKSRRNKRSVFAESDDINEPEEAKSEDLHKTRVFKTEEVKKALHATGPDADNEFQRPLRYGDIFSNSIDYEKEDKSGKIKLLILDILIAILAIAVILTGIMVFAKNTAVGQKLQSLFGLNKETTVEEPVETETTEPTTTETTTPEISAVQNAIIKQAVRNTNIGEIAEDTALKFTEGKDYGMEGVQYASLFTDADWYTTGTGEIVTYMPELIGGTIEYYSRLVDKYNSGSDEVLRLMDSESSYYYEIAAIEPEEGVTRKLSKLQIGEIRRDGDAFYMLVRLMYEFSDGTDPQVVVRVVKLDTSQNEVLVQDIETVVDLES